MEWHDGKTVREAASATESLAIHPYLAALIDAGLCSLHDLKGYTIWQVAQLHDVLYLRVKREQEALVNANR